MYLTILINFPLSLLHLGAFATRHNSVYSPQEWVRVQVLLTLIVLTGWFEVAQLMSYLFLGIFEPALRSSTSRPRTNDFATSL